MDRMKNSAYFLPMQTNFSIRGLYKALSLRDCETTWGAYFYYFRSQYVVCVPILAVFPERFGD